MISEHQIDHLIRSCRGKTTRIPFFFILTISILSLLSFPALYLYLRSNLPSPTDHGYIYVRFAWSATVAFCGVFLILSFVGLLLLLVSSLTCRLADYAIYKLILPPQTSLDYLQIRRRHNAKLVKPYHLLAISTCVIFLVTIPYAMQTQSAETIVQWTRYGVTALAILLILVEFAVGFNVARFSSLGFQASARTLFGRAFSLRSLAGCLNFAIFFFWLCPYVAIPFVEELVTVELSYAREYLQGAKRSTVDYKKMRSIWINTVTGAYGNQELSVVLESEGVDEFDFEEFRVLAKLDGEIIAGSLGGTEALAPHLNLSGLQTYFLSARCRGKSEGPGSVFAIVGSKGPKRIVVGSQDEGFRVVDRKCLTAVVEKPSRWPQSVVIGLTEILLILSTAYLCVPVLIEYWGVHLWVVFVGEVFSGCVGVGGSRLATYALGARNLEWIIGVLISALVSMLVGLLLSSDRR